jgi:hypothetical protein
MRLYVAWAVSTVVENLEHLPNTSLQFIHLAFLSLLMKKSSMSRRWALCAESQENFPLGVEDYRLEVTIRVA